MSRRKNHYQTRRPDGFMSAFEAKMAADLKSAGVPFKYEAGFIRYIQPEKQRRYTPDFILPSGIIIEVKGKFETEDRQKHLMIRDSEPDLDIRFVFSSSNRKIGKRSTTTYGDWCRKKGFTCAEKFIPPAWLKASRGASYARLKELGLV